MYYGELCGVKLKYIMDKEQKTRIDVHCHFFNRKELSALMLLDILHMIKSAEISLTTGSKPQNVNEARQLSRSAKSSISFFMTSLKQPRQIYKKLTGYEKGYVYVPLMLDSYWLTQSPKTNTPYVPQADVITVIRQELENIGESLQNIGKRKSLTNEKRRVSIEIKRIASSFAKLLNKKTFSKAPLRGSTADNFANQEEEIAALQEEYPETIFPFYCVDPRRATNYIELSNGKYDISPVTNKLKINGGHFAGIKLYTPCGYSPTHPMLMCLYKYCEEHEVPIVAHVSGSGVTTLSNELYLTGDIYKDGELHHVDGVWTFENKNLFSRDRILEHSERLNHPMLWEKVLEAYPRLRIDLAHFGHIPHSMEWTNYIWTMMKRKNADGTYKYPNLYTDFANIPDRDALFTFHNRYFMQDGDLQSRFMYGSDYYMNLIYLNDMNEYVENFRNVFTDEEFDMISIENPARFLGLNLS